MSIREIYKVSKSTPVTEGAGVQLKRAFAQKETTILDPFLLLDDFHSDNPDDYIAGFPWHPHRGIETVTYMLEGKVEHQDSIGNQGILKGGDIQWMTAGSGIIHSEMPAQVDGLLWGFQLWVNLPAASKMMPPRYQDIPANDVPEITLENGVKVRILAGKMNGKVGPVQDIVTNPEYLDVTIPPNTKFEHLIQNDYTAFAYCFEGEGYFDASKEQPASAENLIIYKNGDSVQITTSDNNHVRFLLVSGKPIKEPIVWYGPIVMNTQEEIQTAFTEYRNGTFLKSD
ncbi:MAG: pirin family protein [Candidatus Heimdallarchaeota archaeon]|nr:MAG: pirin family protein [Candidatus Heimdallarchaeota archaeon]